MSETFSYDVLNRLTGSTIGETSYVYEIAGDGTGNIITKSDLGTYTYGNTSKPHQLTQVSDAIESINQQDISYTNFNKIDTITKGNDVYIFEYGPDNQRVRMEYVEDGNTTSTIYYSDNSEMEIKNGDTRELSYIYAGDGLAAIHVQRSDGNDTLYYVHKDHLGSIMALSNNKDTDFQYQSFDAWGRYRDPDTWGYSTANRITAINRGYTGHEHLVACNLINMNGRVYDPLMGMFLSPDNYVQAPDFTQNFNRYTYALNNPLVYTDPSGEFIFSLFLPGIGTVLDAMCWGAVIGAGTSASVYSVATLTTGSQWDWNQFGRSATIGAIGGAITGGLAAAGSVIGISTQSVMFQAVSNTVSNATTSLVFNGSVNGMDLVTGLAGGVVGGFAGVGANKLLNGASGNIGGVVQGVVAGGVGGFVSGTTSSLIRNGGDLNAAMKDGLRTAAFSAAQGGIVGAWQTARYDRNIWTGGRKVVSAEGCKSYDGGMGTPPRNQYEDVKVQIGITVGDSRKTPLTIFALKINANPNWAKYHWPSYARDRNFLFLHRWDYQPGDWWWKH